MDSRRTPTTSPRRRWRTSGRNIGRTVTPLVWCTRLDGAALDGARTAVRTARSVFAGPGSPTYALRVWAGTGFDEALAAIAASGGTMTFASAAALTIGVVTVPVYEIYKSGADPAWAAGTNLLERLTGLRAALICTTTTPRAAPTPPASATWASGGCGSWREHSRRARTSSGSTSTRRCLRPRHGHGGRLGQRHRDRPARRRVPGPADRRGRADRRPGPSGVEWSLHT
jgi:hypothetical protein